MPVFILSSEGAVASVDSLAPGTISSVSTCVSHRCCRRLSSCVQMPQQLRWITRHNTLTLFLGFDTPAQDELVRGALLLEADLYYDPSRLGILDTLASLLRYEGQELSSSDLIVAVDNRRPTSVSAPSRCPPCVASDGRGEDTPRLHAIHNLEFLHLKQALAACTC
jgi:hypothetical protein